MGEHQLPLIPKVYGMTQIANGALVKNWTGRVTPVSKEQYTYLLRTRPLVVDPETGKVIQRGFAAATKEEWEAQERSDAERYDKDIRPNDARLELSAKGIVLQVADKKDPLPVKKRGRPKKDDSDEE